MKIISNFPTRFSELIDGMSMSEVGRQIGLSKQTVSAYASGDRNPKKPTINAIAAHFNVSPVWILGFDVDKHENKPANISIDELNPKVVEVLMRLSSLPEDKLEKALDYINYIDR